MSTVNFEAFVDETLKLAAHKTRIGRRPIRVENLLKKETVSKVAAPFQLSPSLLQMLRPAAKPALLLGLGGVAAVKGQQALTDLGHGRQMRQAYEQRQA